LWTKSKILAKGLCLGEQLGAVHALNNLQRGKQRCLNKKVRTGDEGSLVRGEEVAKGFVLTQKVGNLLEVYHARLDW
jgi:hypothetical protein